MRLPGIRFAADGPVKLLSRLLVAAGALGCLPGCQLPGGPGLATPRVTGNWSGTVESSWGVLPVRATLTNETFTSVSGTFTINGRNASGTIRGSLETRDRYSGTLFWGTLAISYLTASGETCLSESIAEATSGPATENAVDIFTPGFPRGNCTDPPTNFHVVLRR
jgi:hypothetical protein